MSPWTPSTPRPRGARRPATRTADLVTHPDVNPSPTFSLSDRYDREQGRIYLSGLQALVRLPVDQCRRDRHLGRNTAAFVSGYEGSPFAGYDLELARQKALLQRHGVVFTPGLNEELALSAVQGSQL